MGRSRAVQSVITPRRLHARARAFFDAAEAIYQASPPGLNLPLALLWGLSIELLLKSYLLKEGVLMDRLHHTFGHDLDKLYAEAQTRGISGLLPPGIDTRIARLVHGLNPEYVARRLHYPPEDGTSYGMPRATARPLIGTLLAKIDQHLKRKT